MQRYTYDPVKDELVPIVKPEEIKIIVKPKPRKKTKHEIYGDCHPDISLIKEIQSLARNISETHKNIHITYEGAHKVKNMNTYDLCKEIIRWAKIDISRGKNAKFVCLSLKSEKELESKETIPE